MSNDTEINAGNQKESVEDAFDFNDPELFDDNNLNWVKEPEKQEEETDESENEEVEGESENVEDEIGNDVEDDTDPRFAKLSKAERFRRTAQQWKDKHYALEGKYEAVMDRLNRLDERLVNPVYTATQKDRSEADELETMVKEQWGDDPALMAIVKRNKALEQRLETIAGSENGKVSQTTYQTIEDFCSANQKFLDNPEIGGVFVDEMNDRLPKGDFGALVKAAQSGQFQDKKLLDSLKSKMERSLAVATGKGVVNPTRKNNAKKRAKNRASSPSNGIQISGNVSPKPQTNPLSYAEALRVAKLGS